MNISIAGCDKKPVTPLLNPSEEENGTWALVSHVIEPGSGLQWTVRGDDIE